MEFRCPMCEASGDLSQDDLTHPVTRTACPQCETILLINPDTGEVDAHKSPLKDSSVFAASGSRPADPSSPVLEMRPRDRSARDWTALVVVAVILLILVLAGVYFAFNPDSLPSDLLNM